MKDIATRADLELLLSRFYERLLQNEEMRHIFIDVAQINMAEHLPTIVDFWEQLLFQTANYHKNVMQLHLDLNAKTPLSARHFQIWINTFNTSVNSHFSGPNAELAKTRALSIGTTMQVKLT